MNNDMNKTPKTCIYKILKGGRKGQICGCNVKNTSEFCSKHKQTMSVREAAIKRLTDRNETYNIASENNNEIAIGVK